MLDFVSGGLTSEGVEIAEADHAKEIAVEQADAKANQPQVQPYVPDSIKAVDTTSDTAVARKDMMVYMLENEKTMEDLKTDKPQMYNSLIDPEQKYPDDVFVAQLAERSWELYGNSKEGKENFTSMTKRLGLYDDVAERLIVTNRFSDGVALTVAQAYSGVNNFLAMVNSPYVDTLAPQYEKLLEADMEANQQLFKLINPSSPNIASAVGEAAPYVGASAVGGTVSTLIHAGTKGMMIADAVANVALTSARAGSETADIGAEDFAIDVLASAIGYKITPKGSANVNTARKEVIANIKPADIQNALNTANKLIEESPKIARHLAPRIKELKGIEATNLNYVEDMTKALTELVDTFKTAKSPRAFNEEPFDINMPKGRVSATEHVEAAMYEWLDGGSIDMEKLLKELKKTKQGNANQRELLADQIKLEYPHYLALRTETPSQFVDILIANKSNLTATGNKEWHTLATVLKKEGTAELKSRIGINALMMFVHMPTMMLSTLATSTTVQNWLLAVMRGVKADGLTGAVKATKETADKAVSKFKKRNK